VPLTPVALIQSLRKVALRERSEPGRIAAHRGDPGPRSLWTSLSPVTPRRAAYWVAAIAAAAAAVHIALLLGSNPAPSVFYDELAYQKLAQSVGQTGQLALFGKQGLTYSPLYPLLLSPLYAFHLSGPTAYSAALVLNCLLFALASLPIYRIARFVLSPGRSIVAVALSSLAPLMLYSSFVMSENLAYPLFLFAVWAMLATICAPRVRADAVVLGLCALCTAARLQFIVLVPVAMAAVLLVAIADPRGTGLRRSLTNAIADHVLLAAANVVLAVAGIAAYVGSRIVSLAGQYGYLRTLPAPYPWRIASFVDEHVGGLVLSLGVIPFVGALVASALWFRRRGRPRTDAFAAVAASVTVAVIVTTAVAAYGQSFGPDLERIHERYYFYVVPLFLIAMIATLGLARSPALVRLGLAAAALGALLPTLVPFGTVINHTVGVDSFGLVIFASTGKHGAVGTIGHATLIAVLLAACLGFVYALARPRPAVVLGVLAVLFAWVSIIERNDQANAAQLAASPFFSSHRDWVDAADRGEKVPLVENPRLIQGGLGVAETAFFNVSISRLYYPCQPILSPQFGEQQVELGPGGRLLDGGAPIRAGYAVVPADGGIEGRVVAVDARARLVLVQPSGGVLRVAPGRGGLWACSS
jgi:hypothetical protein